MRRYAIPLSISLVVVILIGGLLASVVKTHRVRYLKMCTNGEVLSDETRTGVTIGLRKPADETEESYIQCTRHKQVSEIYGQAVTAWGDGDTVKAEQLVGDMIDLDPKIDRQTIMAQLEGRTPTASTTAASPAVQTGSATPATDNGTTETPGSETGNQGSGGTIVPKGANLLTFLPTSVAGLRAGVPEKDVTFAGRSYSSGQKKGLESAILTVRWHRTAADAESARRRIQDRVGPNDRKTSVVNGQTATFGTNGQGYAIMSWTVSNLSFEILITYSDSAAKAMFDKAIDIGRAFPEV